MTANAIHLHSSDNICVASEDLQSGDCVMVDEETVTVQQAIKMGHKVAIASGNMVRLSDLRRKRSVRVIGFTHIISSMATLSEIMPSVRAFQKRQRQLPTGNLWVTVVPTGVSERGTTLR